MLYLFQNVYIYDIFEMGKDNQDGTKSVSFSICLFLLYEV